MATRLPKVTVSRDTARGGGYVVACSACDFTRCGGGDTTTRYDADRIAQDHRASHGNAGAPRW